MSSCQKEKPTKKDLNMSSVCVHSPDLKIHTHEYFILQIDFIKRNRHVSVLMTLLRAYVVFGSRSILSHFVPSLRGQKIVSPPFTRKISGSLVKGGQVPREAPLFLLGRFPAP